MEDFVSYELAKKLKEKGFREKVNAYYGKRENIFDVHPALDMNDADYRVSAPIISQVLKWLRKEKKIFVAVNLGYCYESHEKPFPTNPKMEPILKGYYYGIWDLGNLNDENGHSEYFESPELATLAGIEYVIDNLI